MSQCSAGVRAKFPNRCPLFATNAEDWGPVFFFGPFRADFSCATDPGLAPWAAFLRRFAAIELSSATWNKRCDECHSAARVSEQNSRIDAHCSRRTRRIGDLCFSLALSGLTSLAPLTQGLRPGLHSCAASRLSNCRAQHGTKDVMNVTVQRGCPSKIPESVPIVRDERGGLGTCVFLSPFQG